MKLFISFVSFIFSLSLFSADIEPLTQDELVLLVTDDTLRNENVILNQLQVEAFQYIAETEADIIKVSEAIFSFYVEDV